LKQKLSKILKGKINHISEMVDMSNRYDIGIVIQLTKINTHVSDTDIINIQNKFRSFDYVSSFSLDSFSFIFGAYFTKEIGSLKVSSKFFHLCEKTFPGKKISSSYNFYQKQDNQFFVDLIEGICMAEQSENSYLINFEHEKEHIIV
jgi:hypothetical protein